MNLGIVQTTFDKFYQILFVTNSDIYMILNILFSCTE